MSSIKQLIINAIIKVSAENPALNREDQPTHEEARDMFIAALMAELFPEHGNESVVQIPVVAPAPTLPERVAQRKLTKEEKAAEKEAEKAAKLAAKEAEKAAKIAEKEAEKAKKEAEKQAAKSAKEAAKAATPPKKSPEEKAAEKEAEKAKKEAEKEAAKQAKEAEKAAEKAKKEAEKEAEKAKKEAEKEAAKQAKEAEKAAKEAEKQAAKAAKSPKKLEGNLAKIDPTWRKALKEESDKGADKGKAKELEPELLKYVNALSNAAFHDKPAREHVVNFLASRAPAPAPVEPQAQVDLEVVEFQGKEYYVNPETKRVYEGELNEDGELTVTRPVGYVGMADFKDMKLEDEEE